MPAWLARPLLIIKCKELRLPPASPRTKGADMPHPKITSQPTAPGQRWVRASLEQIIACLQDCTDDDQVVIQAVVELMRQGRLRRPLLRLAAKQELAA